MTRRSRIPLSGLAANPALPPELLDRLIALAVSGPGPDREADADAEAVEELCSELAERRDLSPAQVRALADADEHTAVLLAREGRLSAAAVDPAARPAVALAMLDEGTGRPEWARPLAAHPDREVRWRLASCPGLPSDVVETLAADPDIEVVAELALWTAEPEAAARLAAHPHAEVRMSAALNEAVPPAALVALITGQGLAPAASCLVCDREPVPFTHDPSCPRPDCTLRPGAACAGGHESTVHDALQRAARNPATPTAVVAALAGHPSKLVRWSLAERTDLPQEVYAGLVEDPVPGVRYEAAGNPALGEPLVRTLAAGAAREDDELRRRLAGCPGLPLDVLAELAVAGRIRPVLLPAVAAAAPEALAEAASSPHAAVRMLVAERRDLPPAVRDRLAADPDAAVVKAVAPHPGLSEAQLRAVVSRDGVRVLARVAANPDAPAGLLEELVRHEPPVRRVLREVAVHRNATAAALLPCLDDARARPAAAAHPALPVPVIVGLLSDADPAVARAAAANPSLPRPAMERLLDDASREGRGSGSGPGGDA
ncbi:hypothetical protein ACFVGY_30285 [Streptomyces sp. NPDC127106]|uniref:hypothetical protein n=1 Tax=Streptomyces sp. NPDC127106 TaxID=3345360 RepID=UPI00362CB594